MATSRKSSRKSSKRSSSLSRKSSDSSDSSSILDPNTKEQSLNFKIITLVFSLVLNGIILYYLYNLEDITCQCIRDWRHNFIKAMSYVALTIAIIPLFGLNINKMFPMLLGVIGILGAINIYAVYTYVGDLNETKCSCAIDKQPQLNWFMNAYRYFIVGMLLFILIIGIIGILYLLKIATFN